MPHSGRLKDDLGSRTLCSNRIGIGLVSGNGTTNDRDLRGDLLTVFDGSSFSGGVRKGRAERHLFVGIKRETEAPPKFHSDNVRLVRHTMTANAKETGKESVFA